MSASENQRKVVKFVQELLLEEDKSAITPALISQRIDSVLTLNRSWGEGLDRNAVTDELIRRFSLWIGQDTALSNNTGHLQWLDAERKRNWRYWQRYSEWLERTLSNTALDALDRSTDAVLGLLEDPNRQDSWDRRGLVVGNVQSGKTANYTGLICKAADAGYKIVIVLAGLHNNLRSQTQMRLDEGFLGYETKPTPEDIKVIGVGEIDGDPAIRPNYATNRSERGDFSTSAARNLGVTPEQRPWLFVVKKNKTILERLYQWIRNHVADTEDPDTGRRIVSKLPLLLIDDEADHASVDTGEQLFDEDGQPDSEHEPTAINSRIRKILHAFGRAAYVGYTATPFANIFIHERGETREEGPDLFPAAFIVRLAAPSDYVGPARLLGLLTPEGRQGGLPLIRINEDHCSADGREGWMPLRHKNGYLPRHNGLDVLPDSLVSAIDAFLLACAARRVRGHGQEHASMLVHVTRFNSIQREVHRQIDTYVSHLRQRFLRRIDNKVHLVRMRGLWESDFQATTEDIRRRHPNIAVEAAPSWESIEAQLPDVLHDVLVRMINGTAKDALDYTEHEGRGLKVIAVGGDKLARGLTLEGLCTSYFLRASKMYDTLMQMGRWFGYRPGYVDLCRLYTTAELTEWFGHIADAAEELQEEFDLMASSGATPREYGLKVQSHPVLLVTSRLKMRTAKNLLLSFSGELLETVALHRREDILADNMAAARTLVAALGKSSEVNPKRVRADGEQAWQGFLWRNASSSDVIEFLSSYKSHPDAYKVRSDLLAEFIRSMVEVGQLTNWTVALIGGGEGGRCTILGDVAVNMLKRVNNGSYETRYSIGRLMSTRDESIDLDASQWSAALEATRAAWSPDPAKATEDKPQEPPDVPNGPAMRKIRGFGAEGVAPTPERGLLLLYALDPALAKAGFPTDTPPVVAFGISFPGSTAGKKVLYKVNSVEWQQWEREYGPSN
jgi:hypothetical protein